MSFDPTPAALALRNARAAGHPAGPLPAAIVPADEIQGAAVQRALAGLLDSDPPGGFKIGATSPRMREYLGLAGPLGGFMRAADLLPSGATIPFAGLRGPGVECEIGVRLAADLPPGPCTPDQAGAAVGEMFAAIELVENRYGPPPAGDLVALGVPTLLADQIFHRAAILGPPADWRGLDLATIQGRISFDGSERAAGLGSELLGHPLAALAWLAGSVTAAAFGGLRAGQVIMLGSVTPPIWLAGPCHVEVAFTGLGAVAVAFS
jgi:2-keto-4-pentenoate hydratase